MIAVLLDRNIDRERRIEDILVVFVEKNNAGRSLKPFSLCHDSKAEAFLETFCVLAVLVVVASEHKPMPLPK